MQVENPLRMEPSAHSYLGNTLVDDDKLCLKVPKNDSVYDLLVIPLRDVVLFPGETVPLRVQNPTLAGHINGLLQARNSETVLQFGIVNFGRSGIASYGTSIEIKSRSRGTNIETIDNSETGGIEIIMTAKGKHRFKIVSMRRQSGGVLYASVQVFREALPQPLSQTYGANNRLHHTSLTSFPSWVYHVNSAQTLARRAYDLFVRMYCKSSDSYGSDSGRRELLFHNNAAVVNQWGPYFNASSINSNISSGGNNNNNDNSSRSDVSVLSSDFPPPAAGTGAEADPVAFSYFLAANMSLSVEQLLLLQCTEDVISRLRLIIQMLNDGEHKRLCCGRCGLALASKQDVFSVPGASGMVGAYVNPHGVVHQTLTVRSLLPTVRRGALMMYGDHQHQQPDIIFSGAPTPTDSWFPGFSWSIMSCGICYNHLGWRFTVDGYIPHDVMMEDEEGGEDNDNEAEEEEEVDEDEEGTGDYLIDGTEQNTGSEYDNGDGNIINSDSPNGNDALSIISIGRNGGATGGGNNNNNNSNSSGGGEWYGTPEEEEEEEQAPEGAQNARQYLLQHLQDTLAAYIHDDEDEDDDYDDDEDGHSNTNSSDDVVFFDTMMSGEREEEEEEERRRRRRSSVGRDGDNDNDNDKDKDRHETSPIASVPALPPVPVPTTRPPLQQPSTRSGAGAGTAPVPEDDSNSISSVRTRTRRGGGSSSSNTPYRQHRQNQNQNQQQHQQQHTDVVPASHTSFPLALPIPPPAVTVTDTDASVGVTEFYGLVRANICEL